NRRNFFADAFDYAAELVPERQRRLDARLRPAVPAVDVQIGAANRGGAHAHQHFIRPDAGNRYALQLRAPLRAHLPESLHCCGRHSGSAGLRKTGMLAQPARAPALLSEGLSRSPKVQDSSGVLRYDPANDAAMKYLISSGCSRFAPSAQAVRKDRFSIQHTGLHWAPASRG